MSTEDKKKRKEKKHCARKKSLMLAFGLTTLSTRVISALSLAAIALSLCFIKNEAKLFNNCVEEIKQNGQSDSAAVRFCNGG